jgi:hypothetical protein
MAVKHLAAKSIGGTEYDNQLNPSVEPLQAGI